MSTKPKIYTPEEANRLIPRLIDLLPQLKQLRDEVVRTQNKCDIEEITSFGSSGDIAEEARRKMDEFQTRIHAVERDFGKKLRFFEEVGCELKGLDPGLVDFYSEKDGELVYLCWREGEDRISYWHPLNAGFSGRQRLL